VRRQNADGRRVQTAKGKQQKFHDRLFGTHHVIPDLETMTTSPVFLKVDEVIGFGW